MITTRDDAMHLANAEVCPVCAATEVRVVELGWFALDLDRGDELRTDDPGAELEFRCDPCGSRWD